MNTISISSPIPVLSPQPGDPAPSDSVAMTPSELASYSSNAIGGLDASIDQAMEAAQANPSDPSTMLNLENLVSQRQQLVELASNLIESFNQTSSAVIQNIGRS